MPDSTTSKVSTELAKAIFQVRLGCPCGLQYPVKPPAEWLARIRRIAPKQLADYPVGEPFEAADGCQYCKAKYQLTITRVEGDLGNVEYSITHEEDCIGRWDEDGDLDREPDIVGWTLSPQLVRLGVWNGQPLTYRANIGPCLNCWKLVVGVPLILFPAAGAYEMDFCFKCVEDLQLMKQMKPRGLNGL